MYKINVNENIYMRKMVENDAREVFDVIDKNRIYLRQWLPWVDDTITFVDVENVITSWEKQYEEGSDFVLGIFKNNYYIGNIGLNDIKNGNGIIGYWLAENEQNQGIMINCVKMLINYGFNSLYLNKIFIQCADKNLKSRAIPKYLGFSIEEIIENGEYLYGEYFNLVIYGITKRAWFINILQLTVPKLEHKQKAMEYRQEYIDFKEDHINGSGGMFRYDNYESWLEKITNAQTASQTGWVNCSTYFAFINNEIVGTIQIRHSLNDLLIKAGGHIGYSVRPSKRQNGYATRMLELALEKCRELKIAKVLITCDKDNIASEKTILKHGGIFENEFIEENGNIVLRYWISI